MNQNIVETEAGVSEDLRIQLQPGDSPTHTSLPPRNLGNDDVHLCRVRRGVPVHRFGHFVLDPSILIVSNWHWHMVSLTANVI